MQYAFGVLGMLGFMLGFAVFRYLQFRRRYSRVLQSENPKMRPVIFMLDYYCGTTQRTARLLETARLYQALKSSGDKPRVLLTVGKLACYDVPVSYINRRDLVEMGVAYEDIETFFGSHDFGVDTLKEVRLACQWLKLQRMCTVHVVTDTLHWFQVFFLCIFHGIFPYPHLVELLEIDPSLIAGRLLSVVITFFDPNGHNPLSTVVRFKRRYISAN